MLRNLINKYIDFYRKVKGILIYIYLQDIITHNSLTTQNSKAQSRKRNIPRCLPLAARVANDAIDIRECFRVLNGLIERKNRPLRRDGLCII